MNTQLFENRNLYKIFLSVIKYTPMIISLIHVFASIIHYFGITSNLLACFGGTSILFIIIYCYFLLKIK